jgi:hypothetical protein
MAFVEYGTLLGPRQFDMGNVGQDIPLNDDDDHLVSLSRYAYPTPYAD